MPITLSIRDRNGAILAQKSNENTVFLVYDQAYEQGDVLRVETSELGSLVDVCLDNASQSATLYLENGFFDMPVPFGAQKQAYAPSAFEGNIHRLTARSVEKDHAPTVQNLALNPYDHGANKTVFPHVTATSETRGEAAFSARNVIDGEIANSDHGFWPFTSWGINQDPNASLTIHFGRAIIVTGVTLFIRADFPHDAWWEKARLTTSDEWTTHIALSKTSEGQHFLLPSKKTNHLILDQLIKADDPSPFPALTQIEVWGMEQTNVD